MAEVHGGQLVVQALEKEGVTHLFTLSGGHIDKILDACAESKISVIDVRHEQAAAMMAYGWSMATGKLGVCLVTAGPGLTNADHRGGGRDGVAHPDACHLRTQPEKGK